MVLETILSSDLAVYIIYPFLFVFVLLFAILEKSKILGEDKHQINSVISLSMALISIAFPWAREVIVNLMPFLAVSATVILVFLILYGFVASTNDKGLEINKNVQIGLTVLAALFVIVTVIVVTGQWNRVYSWLFIDYGSGPIWGNILLFAIIIGVFVVVLNSGKGKKSSE